MKLWSLSASSPLTSTYWFGTKVTSLVEKSVTPKFSLITASALAKSFGATKTSMIPSSKVTSLTSTSPKTKASTTASLSAPSKSRTPNLSKAKETEPELPILPPLWLKIALTSEKARLVLSDKVSTITIALPGPKPSYLPAM